jgi:hypothetical protein
MDKTVKTSRMTNIEPQCDGSGNSYQYSRYKFIKGENGYKSKIAFLRLPPKKAAFPLHYHEYSESPP